MENNINSQSQNSIDQKKLQNFMEVILSDLSGAYSTVQFCYVSAINLDYIRL
jgi:hypothetical protein